LDYLLRGSIFLYYLLTSRITHGITEVKIVTKMKKKNCNILLNQELPQVLAFIKGKKRQRLISALFLLPKWDFIIDRDNYMCFFFLRIEIRQEIITLGLLDKWREAIKEASKEVASAVYCYLFKVPGYKVGDVSVYVEAKEHDNHLCLMLIAFLKDLNALRMQVLDRMITYIEERSTKDIEGILVDAYKKDIDEILINGLEKSGLVSFLENLGLKKEFAELAPAVLYSLNKDSKLFSALNPNPRQRILFYLSFCPHLLGRIREWRELVEDLTKKGLIDKFCNPQVPIRDVLKEIKILGAFKIKCPFCGREVKKLRGDRLTCGSVACRMAKSRLKRKVKKLIEEGLTMDKVILKVRRGRFKEKEPSEIKELIEKILGGS